MRSRLAVTSIVAAGILAACSTDVITALQFRIQGVVTTKLALDSVTCTITFKSQMNDPTRPYVVQVVFAGDTGVAPDTGTIVSGDSLLTNGPATVEGDFRAPKLAVGWTFFWDTLKAIDSAHVRACVVQ
jgi:hypothetical protein